MGCASAVRTLGNCQRVLPPPLALWSYLLVLLLQTDGARAVGENCLVRMCDMDFAKLARANKVLEGANVPFCLLLRQYQSCLESTARQCRGHLRFHSTLTLTSRVLSQHNCSTILKDVDVNEQLLSSTDAPVSDPLDGAGPCLFPYHQGAKGSSAFRYCSLFGDPHIRTFDAQQETCRAVGAWPLLDNAYLAVQVTNERMSHGVAATGITKVTVIVRATSGCTGQKTFEATKDDLPGAFTDGTRHIPYSDPQPAVQVKTLRAGQAVQILLRHIATQVLIRRQRNGYLTLAIRVPEEVIEQQSSVSALQLCLTGCPAQERLNYKEVLAHPAHFIQSLGMAKPSMRREDAVRFCRDLGLVDFFFDSCVFDLLVAGDLEAADGAVLAQEDIRSLYPPYRRHYETNRTDLHIYDDYAKQYLAELSNVPTADAYEQTTSNGFCVLRLSSSAIVLCAFVLACSYHWCLLHTFGL